MSAPIKQIAQIEQIAQLTHDFLIEEILEEDIDLDFDSPLLTEVGVDSLGMLRLVTHLEAAYDITISPIYFTIENFQHIHAISTFIHSLIHAKAK